MPDVIVSPGSVRVRETGDPTLVELVATMLRGRMLVVRMTLLFGLIGAIVALAAGRTYTSDFKFTPQESTPMGGLSAIASDFGVNIGANASQSPDFYIDLIQTREVLWRLLDAKFTLATPKGPQTFTLLDSIEPTGPSLERRREDATIMLRKMILARADLKTSVVAVSVKTKTPEMAAQMALRLIDEINHFNAETRRSRAAAQRQFAEQQVEAARAALRVAENANENWLNTNKIFASSAELQFQKNRLDRELNLRDQQYVALTQQLQSSRMEEVRNIPVITIVERPVVPAKGDPRGLLSKSILGAFLGFVLGLVVTFVREALRRSSRSDTDDLDEFRVLRAEVMQELRNPAATVRRIFLPRSA